jgi:hypothetical protein
MVRWTQLPAGTTDKWAKSNELCVSGITPANSPPTVSILSPSSSSESTEGDSVTFSGTATDNEDGSLSSSIQWTSSIDGFLATGNFFSLTTLSVGTHTITAKVTDSGGLTASKQVSITVNGEIPPANSPPTVSISSPSSGSSFTEGDSVTFQGTATDDEDGSLSSQIQWTSSIDGSIGTGSTYTTTNLSIGTHTITAQVTDSGEMSDTDSITITVNAPIQTSVTITSPQNNETVKGKFTITVDTSGFEGLTTVKFIVDGETIATDQASPYQITVVVKDFSKGQHTLVVEVSDANSFDTDSIVFRR